MEDGIFCSWTSSRPRQINMRICIKSKELFASMCLNRSLSHSGIARKWFAEERSLTRPVETVLEVQDAVESAAPNPKAETLEKSDTTLPKGPVLRGSGARAVWNQGWLAFIGSGISGGWCDYAECKVKYSPCEGKFLDPRADVNTEQYSYRTTLMHSDEESWHVVESNALIHPWDRSMDGLLEVVGATITILSKNELDLQTPDATPSTLPGPSEIEVFNPYTSKAEMIRSDDPKFYDAGGFKTRRYQGSSKPRDIPSFVWQSMSVKQRRLAIAEEQKRLARVADMAATA